MRIIFDADVGGERTNKASECNLAVSVLLPELAILGQDHLPFSFATIAITDRTTELVIMICCEAL